MNAANDQPTRIASSSDGEQATTNNTTTISSNRVGFEPSTTLDRQPSFGDFSTYRRLVEADQPHISVSPMSSGVGWCGLLDIVEEGPVDDVGQFSFEESEGFSFG
jgi:hypothetical protein